VRDVAQRAVGTPEPGADPVRQLAAQRVVGVVDPDEPHERGHAYRYWPVVTRSI